MIDFDLGPETQELRAEVRSFLSEHLDPAIHERMEKTGTHHDRAFAEALGAKGWIASGWPVSEGGGGRSWLEQVVISQELSAADAPTAGIGTTMLVANTLRIWGTPEQKEEVLPGIVRGEIQVCLGYSEADSGSDVAAARTRAIRDGEEWNVNGEKMFTSLAQIADYVFLLTRTNLDVKKHKGLTMFLIPMSTPGIVISEIKTLGGERTNVTSYQDVRVPDACRVGAVDGGWSVLTSALNFEHAVNYGPEVARVLRVAAEEASKPAGDGTRLIDDSSVRERLARVAIEVEVSELLGLRANWLAATGQAVRYEGSMAKVYSSEALARA
ncbi:MAG TPA: acyl-CoA dehydrogenase family protein, partial [Acidimicrobiales bacterium]|nr:acyl-CoA dehydrogenase family protein [Acidimicrobiales bacterium]